MLESKDEDDYIMPPSWTTSGGYRSIATPAMVPMDHDMFALRVNIAVKVENRSRILGIMDEGVMESSDPGAAAGGWHDDGEGSEVGPNLQGGHSGHRVQ